MEIVGWRLIFPWSQTSAFAELLPVKLHLQIHSAHTILLARSHPHTCKGWDRKACCYAPLPTQSKATHLQGTINCPRLPVFSGNLPTSSFHNPTSITNLWSCLVSSFSRGLFSFCPGYILRDTDQWLGWHLHLFYFFRKQVSRSHCVATKKTLQAELQLPQ